MAREEVRRAWFELRGPTSSPGRAAVSVALGLFVGSIPIFGCHTFILVGLCLWFRLDGAIAWLVSNVSNPLFAPALLTGEVQLGAWLRTGSLLRLDEEAMRAGALQHFVGYMFLGAPVAGGFLAATGAAVTFAVVALSPRRASREPYQLPADAPEWVKAVERVATRYASPASSTASERSRFHYLRAKMLADPVTRLVADVAGDAPGALGEVLDVGTGRGQLPLLLLELGRAPEVRGIDWDASKLASARAALARGEGDRAARADATFVCADLRVAELNPADTVLLIDVLHYLAREEQDRLLDRAVAAVRPGGRLVVREADTDRGWRSAATWLEERFFTWIRFNRGDRVQFRPVREIAARLQDAGLACSIKPAWGRTPFSNVLLVARRPRT